MRSTPRHSTTVCVPGGLARERRGGRRTDRRRPRPWSAGSVAPTFSRSEYQRLARLRLVSVMTNAVRAVGDLVEVVGRPPRRRRGAAARPGRRAARRPRPTRCPRRRRRPPRRPRPRQCRAAGAAAVGHLEDRDRGRRRRVRVEARARSRRSSAAPGPATVLVGSPKVAGASEPGRRRSTRGHRSCGSHRAVALVLEVVADEDVGGAEQPGHRRQRGGLEPALLHAPVEGLEEVGAGGAAERDQLAGDDRPVGEARPTPGRGCGPTGSWRSRCRGAPAPARRPASRSVGRVGPPRREVARSRWNRSATRPVRHWAGQGQRRPAATTSTPAPAPAAACRRRSASSPAASRPARPSATSAPARCVLRSDSTRSDWRLSARTASPAGDGSAVGKAPTAMTVPSGDEHREVGPVAPPHARAPASERDDRDREARRRAASPDVRYGVERSASHGPSVSPP